MASRYFVGDTDSHWNDASNWAASSGGAGGAGVPTATDDVFFDANSPDCLLDLATAVAKSVDCTGFANDLDLNGNRLNTGDGSVLLVAGMTLTHNNGEIDMAPTTGTVTIATAGKTLYDFSADGFGSAVVQLADAMTCENEVEVNSGEFDLNDQDLTAILFDFNGGTVNAGSGDINLSGTTADFDMSAGTFNAESGTIKFQRNFTITGGTFNAGTGTIEEQGSISKTINVAGQTFNNWVRTIIGGYGTTLLSDLDVNGDYTNNDGYSISGAYKIKVAGDLIANGSEISTGSGFLGFELDGSGTQNITPGSATDALPSIRLNNSGTVVVGGDFVLKGSWIRTSGTGADFATNSVKVTLTGGASFEQDDDVSVFYDVEMDYGSYTRTFSADWHISNDFTLTAIGGANGSSSIYIGGDVSSADTSMNLYSNRMILNGSGDQQIDGPGALWSVEIDKSAGDVVFGSSWLVYNSFRNKSASAIDAGTYTLGFQGTGAEIAAGGQALYSIETKLTYNYNTLTIIGLLTLEGDLLLTDGRLAGSVDVEGDVVATSDQTGGTAAITLTGSGAQSIDCGSASTMPSGTFTIDKPAGTATLASALVLDSSGQDLVIIEGTLDLAGYDLTVNDILDVDDDGRLKLKGTETVSRTTITLDGTIEFYDSGVTAFVTNYGSTFGNMIFGASKTHQFANGIGSEITVNGTLESAGTSSTRAVLRSDSDGNQWYIDLQGSSILDDAVDVKDSNAGSGKDVYAIGSQDSGNNSSEWIFSAAAGGGGAPIIGSPIIKGAGQ